MIPQAALEAAKAAIRKESMKIHGWGESENSVTKAALEAAAPYLRAQALEDAASYIEDCIKAGADDPISPDATRNWLRARAATERGGQ